MKELSELGIKILILDVTSEDSVKSTRDAIWQLTDGKLDILVNNA